MTRRYVETNTWGRGELYDFLCLTGTAICLWNVGVHFDLFSRLIAFMLASGLSSVMGLILMMSFFVAIVSVRKSLLLRWEMAGRAAAEAQALTLARHDPLTGLLNRRVLSEAIQAAALRPTDKHAVLLIDLDRFKAVNDHHGHEAGDLVLREAADRIKALLPDGGVAARLGGDEFALLLPYHERAALMRLADQIVQGLSVPAIYNGNAVEVGATVGVALSPDDGSEAEALLRCADIAMYRSKRESRGAYRFFEQSMDEELRARRSLEASLRAAIRDGDIRPHYQPLVSLPGQIVSGFEVLARWYHPDHGVLTPNTFIGIAEDTGMIADLSFAMLRQACGDARAWPKHLFLAVNVSPHQLRDVNLAEKILAILAESGFDPHRLEIEITESALTSDMETARAIVGTLQRAGVSIALDDFGTGYSSLCHLRDINFDKIKIDRSFVQSMGENAESAKIVSAIIGLGKSMGVLTTAEGIENAANREWLAAQGCSCGQGYLFGRPMAASDIDRSFIDGTFDVASPETAAA